MYMGVLGSLIIYLDYLREITSAALKITHIILLSHSQSNFLPWFSLIERDFYNPNKTARGDL